MTDATATEAPATKKSSPLRAMLVGLVLLALGAGGGYFAVRGGFVPVPAKAPPPAEDSGKPALNDFSYLPVEPLIVSLQGTGEIKQLRFRSQLEVPGAYVGEVEQAMPRIVDMMNGYLRAVPPTDLLRPSALLHLRAQLLRRLEFVVGEGKVRNLLVMEFLLK